MTTLKIPQQVRMNLWNWLDEQPQKPQTLPSKYFILDTVFFINQSLLLFWWKDFDRIMGSSTFLAEKLIITGGEVPRITNLIWLYKWGDNKPEKELAMFWNLCQPFLFSSVGASILFSNIETSIIGKGLGTIFIGLIIRWIGTFMCLVGQGFTTKERAFFAFAWVPKATV